MRPANARQLGVVWGPGVMLAIGFVWSYLPTLRGLWTGWWLNADYSSGALVPPVAAYVIWTRRKDLAGLPRRICWWGLGLLVLAQVARLAAVLMGYGSIEQYSLVLTIAAATLFVFGYPISRKLMWIMAFLVLMAPFPRRIHGGLSLPLQEFATRSAVFGLELLGYLVGREGNVLRLSDQSTVAVAEACSGLRMLTAFIVVGAALAFVVNRPLWHKAVVVLATIPVAVLANTIRLIVTAMLYEAVSSEVAERFFHDFAGVTMMPFAVAVLVAILGGLRWMSGTGPAAGRTRDTAKVRVDLGA